MCHFSGFNSLDQSCIGLLHLFSMVFLLHGVFYSPTMARLPQSVPGGSKNDFNDLTFPDTDRVFYWIQLVNSCLPDNPCVKTFLCKNLAVCVIAPLC